MKCPFKPIKETTIYVDRYVTTGDKTKTEKKEKVVDFGECDKDCAAYKECCCTLTNR